MNNKTLVFGYSNTPQYYPFICEFYLILKIKTKKLLLFFGSIKKVLFSHSHAYTKLFLSLIKPEYNYLQKVLKNENYCTFLSK